MKKILSVIFIICILFCFSSCTLDLGKTATGESGSDTQAPTGESEESSTSTTPKESNNESNNESNEKTPEWKKDNTLKILTIGNSFSDDTMEYVYDIAKSAGVENIKLGNLYIGGCTLNTHAANARNDSPAYEYRTNHSGKWYTALNYRMSDALISEDWDFVSLQQASGSSGVSSTYSELTYMINYVKQRAPKAKIVWNMTWAYQQTSNHDEFKKYNNDQLTMYESILSAVEDNVKTKKAISMIVPNGTAIQNARTSYIGDTLTRDGFHLSYDLGRYIAGLTFFNRLTEISIDDIEFAPMYLDANQKKVAIESAINAVKTPDDITQSQYTVEPTLPPIDESLYNTLDLGWTMFAYYNTGGTGSKELSKGNDTFHKRFSASRFLTKEELPVGSIIVLADGWTYRPEAWEYNGNRPDSVTVSRFVVTEEWWGNYDTRAFNLSKVNEETSEGLTPDDLSEILIVYVPKN